MRIIASTIRDLLQLHARLGRALGDPLVRQWGRPRSAPASMPPLDVVETSDRYLVRVDLPGLTREDVNVRVVREALEITGELPAFDGNQPDVRLHRAERFRGPFRRVVPLPRDTDGEAIEARLEDGVLTVAIPKVTPAGGRRVSIE